MSAWNRHPRARELVAFLARKGYRVDEFVEIIQDVGQHFDRRWRGMPRVPECARMSLDEHERLRSDPEVERLHRSVAPGS
jgi:hypothetical protein